MKIVAGPWLIRGRGYVVLPALNPGECLEVGDRLRRADGATWIFDGVESRAKLGTCILRGNVAPAIGDELVRAAESAK